MPVSVVKRSARQNLLSANDSRQGPRAGTPRRKRSTLARPPSQRLDKKYSSPTPPMVPKMVPLKIIAPLGPTSPRPSGSNGALPSAPASRPITMMTRETISTASTNWMIGQARRGDELLLQLLLTEKVPFQFTENLRQHAGALADAGKGQEQRRKQLRFALQGLFERLAVFESFGDPAEPWGEPWQVRSLLAGERRPAASGPRRGNAEAHGTFRSERSTTSGKRTWPDLVRHEERSVSRYSSKRSGSRLKTGKFRANRL